MPTTKKAKKPVKTKKPANAKTPVKAKVKTKPKRMTAEEREQKRINDAYKKANPPQKIDVLPGTEPELLAGVMSTLEGLALVRQAARKLQQADSARMIELPSQHGQGRFLLRSLLNSYYTHQANREAAGARIGKKKNNTPMKNLSQREIDAGTLAILERDYWTHLALERDAEKKISAALACDPFWNAWLSKQDQVGPIFGANVLAYIDIHIADSVSKIWKYAGYATGETRGKRVIPVKDYKAKDGEVIKTLEADAAKKKVKRYVVLTNTMIACDRLTRPFLSPCNISLRTASYVAGGNFVKANNPYAREFYYAMHVPAPYRKDKKAMQARPDLAGRSGRYDDSEKMTMERVGGGKPPKACMWKETTELHRSLAATRYMMKMWFKDLYVAWRTFEGLPVREPYSEGKLGIKHSAAAKTP